METESNKSPLLNHTSVMTSEIISAIDNYPQKSSSNFIGIDATLGGGGHSYELLKRFPFLKIIGLDQDPYARKAASSKLKEFKNRITIKDINFANFEPTEKVAFVIADLGVSSFQIDHAERGFSFQNDGPLDMRMDPSIELNAQELLNNLNERELADLIYKYGEERLSRRIARKIKRDLSEKGPYKSTKELAYAIGGCFPRGQRYKKIHPATRTFQALRIGVNKEIACLEKLLLKSTDWLLPEGIITIISFHSIEDKKVKENFKTNNKLLNLTKKPIIPQDIEIQMNKRSRSAKMRIAQLK